MIDIPAESERVQKTIQGIAGAAPAVRWRYSVHSNERFPLRFYASARRGNGPSAEDVLVIAVELFNPVDDLGDRIIVSADIMDEEGVILRESPRYEISLPSESLPVASPEREREVATESIRAALEKIDRWLEREGPFIEGALA